MTEGEAQLSEDMKYLEQALSRARGLHNFNYAPIYALPDEVLLEVFHFARARAHWRATYKGARFSPIHLRPGQVWSLAG